MAELNKEPPSADLVGKYFVLHYYKVLREEPESLFKFYKEDSVFTFVSAPRATPVKTQGAENIGKHIASLALSKCVAHIAGLDAQDAVGGGVLLLVRGTMSTGGDAPRKFVQSFFLAPQPTGYYVKNDIWRFVEEEVKTVAKAVIQSPVDTSSRTAQEDIASTAQAVTVQEPPQVPGSPAASEIAVSPSDRSVVSAASPVSQERTEVEKPSTGQALHEASLEEVSSLETVGTAGLPNESQNGNQAAAASPKEEQPASPATLGDASKPLASVETQKPAAEPSWAALAARRPEPGSVVAPHITRPSASPQTKPKKEAPARSAEGAGVKQHQPVTSIYVSNLPYELEPQKLQDMFKVFGEIKAVAPSRGYAFIEYASAESAQKAIQAAQEKPLVADGRTLKVEKKKVRNVRRDKAKPGRDERRRPPEERSQNGQGAPSSTEKKRERPAGDKRSSPALTGNGRPADRSRAAPGSPATSASTGESTTPKSQPKGRPAGK